jgi:hypothetical protein
VAGLRQEVRDLSERLHAATNVQFTQAGYAGKQTKYNNNWTDLCIRLLAVGNKKAAVLPTVKAVMDFFRISADALPRTNSSVDIAEDVAGVCCMEQVHWEMMEDTGENESASIQIGTDTSPKYNDKRSIMGVNAEIVYTDTTTNKVTRKKKILFPFGRTIGASGAEETEAVFMAFEKVARARTGERMDKTREECMKETFAETDGFLSDHAATAQKANALLASWGHRLVQICV